MHKRDLLATCALSMWFGFGLGALLTADADAASADRRCFEALAEAQSLVDRYEPVFRWADSLGVRGGTMRIDLTEAEKCGIVGCGEFPGEWRSFAEADQE